jgi:DNA modification methylase
MQVPPNPLPLNQILVGDCLDHLARLPDESVDMIFADPPYNLQLRQELWRPNQTRVAAVDDTWDHFSDFQAYDSFTRAWLGACRRVLKRTGTLWVIGTYHNIFRVGAILQDLGFWVLNDIVWIKDNPMPNFRGVRFTNAHETLLWVQKERGAPYTFNHHSLKALNDDLQMRSDWQLPICNGRERLRSDGEKVHSAQKPESLLYRVILASSQPGDIILDPFFGTGTTGVVARRLGRQWIGIEQDTRYAELASQRIAETPAAAPDNSLFVSPNPRKRPRIPFGRLVEEGLLVPGQILYFGVQGDTTAQVLVDGALRCNGQRGSIHSLARHLRQGPCNGWELWYYQDPLTGQRWPVDRLRQLYRAQTQADQDR